jgi:large subunit ribosomal protein L24
MKRKLKRDDNVIVTTGKDRKKTGKITTVLSDGRAIVAGVNLVKKHVRPNPQQGIEGGIVEREAPIQMSNLAILNPKTNKADRIAFEVDKNGKKVRVYKSDRAPVDS